MLANTKYAGSDWVKKSLKVANMSPVGEEAADFLGDLFLGIYHLNSSQLRKVEWDNDLYIRIVISANLATFDGDLLTRLVVLSHDRMLRVEVNPCNFRYMELLIHKRKSREGDTYHRMPTMEYHMKSIRDAYAIKPIE